MRLAHLARASVVLASLLALAPSARADEVKVPLKDVPKAILDAVKAEFPRGELKGAEKETEDGKTTFEVSLKDGGHAVDVSLKDDGTILEVEKEVAAGDLPAAVAAALKAKYPAATIKKAEEIVKHEAGKKARSYEAIMATGKETRVEVKLSTEGKVLAEAKVEDEEDDDDKKD